MSDLLAGSPRAIAVRELKSLILDGSLVPGAPLPSQRRLAEVIGVSQPTVRRALAVLEAEGWLGPQRGYTRLVKEDIPASEAPSILRECIVVVGHRRSTADDDSGGSLAFISYGISDAIADHGYHAMVLNPDRLTRRRLLQHLGAPPLGIAWPEHLGRMEPSVDLAKVLLESGLPAIAYGDRDEVGDFDRIVSDHAHGARLLTEFLLQRGARRPLLILPQEAATVYWVKARQAGYRATMSEAGLSPLPTLWLPELAAGEFNSWQAEVERTAEAAEALLAPCFDEGIDAILAPNDWAVPAVSRACQHLGKRVPEDIGIVGYDNIWDETLARGVESPPPLATVDRLNYQLGREMVELLLRRLVGELEERPVVNVLPPALIVL